MLWRLSKLAFTMALNNSEYHVKKNQKEKSHFTKCKL